MPEQRIMSMIQFFPSSELKKLMEEREILEAEIRARQVLVDAIDRAERYARYRQDDPCSRTERSLNARMKEIKPARTRMEKALKELAKNAARN